MAPVTEFLRKEFLTCSKPAKIVSFWLSSIVNEAVKIISSWTIFFTKRFWAHKKHQSAKQTTFIILEDFVREKLLPLLFFVRLFLFRWLVGLKFLWLAWNCLDSLIYYTTGDIFVLFNSTEHLKSFQSYLDSRHVNKFFANYRKWKRQQNVLHIMNPIMVNM